MPNVKETTMSKIKTADAGKRPTPRWKYPALIAAPVLIVLATLLIIQPWSMLFGPQRVMAEVYAAATEVQSYREVSSMTSTSEGRSSEATSSMEFAAPDRYHMKTTMNDEVYEFIIIGDKQYIRQPGNGDWDEGEVNVAVAIVDSTPSQEKTLELLGKLTDLNELNDEKIDDVDCLHSQGRVDVDRLVKEQKAELDTAQPGYERVLEALEQMRSLKIEVELWIGKEDYLIRKMKQDMQAPVMETTSGGGTQERWDTSSLIVKYYDFNEPIEIEPPENISGELAPGWYRIVSPSKGAESEEPPYPSQTPPASPD